MPKPLASRFIFLLWVLMLFAPMEILATGEPQPADNLQTKKIKQEFALFSAEWVKKINRNYTYNQDRIQVLFENARFVGRYIAVDKESVSWSVKRVSNSPLAYIGRLEYLEWTFESVASTREEALQGSFVPVKGRRVMELFLYNNNRWVR
jgi:hypothetical protein